MSSSSSPSSADGGAVPPSYEATGKRLIVYHTNWATYGRNFQVRDLPIRFISDINYAFLDLKRNAEGYYVPVFSDPWADTDKRFTNDAESVPPADPADGGGPYFGNLGQLRKLKQMDGVQFKLGFSVGGWTFSKHFSEAVATEASRQAFVDALVEILRRFDGLFERIDLDWEHISPPGKNHGDPGNTTNPNDGTHFAMFLELLRATLDSIDALRHVEITACVTGDPDNMAALPLNVMSTVLASINIMTYDYASSSWGPMPATHQSNLFPSPPHALRSVHGAVEAYLARGVPPHKIVIGAVTYSRGFANTNGLGYPSHGVVPDKSWEDGVCDYKTLPRPGAVEHWDDIAKAGYSYDPQRRILNSYDTVTSVQHKCKYVWDRGLGGIIVWESSGDLPVSDRRSLFAAMYDGLARDPRTG